MQQTFCRVERAGVATFIAESDLTEAEQQQAIERLEAEANRLAQHHCALLQFLAEESN